VSYIAKAWCRGHVDYDDVVILPIDKSELPDKVWAVDQPDRPVEYRYNRKADLKSIVEADDSDFEMGAEHRDRIWHVLTIAVMERDIILSPRRRGQGASSGS
jgi:hypothetical protein